MTVHSDRVTAVTVNPVRLDTATEADYAVGSPAFAKTYGQSITIWNRSGSISVFLGGPGVTALDGFELVAGADFSCDITPDEGLYGITSSSTALCHVLQVGV